MKTMFQGGLNGRVPVSPEKRYLIHKGSALSAHSPLATPPPIEVTRKTIESVLAEHCGIEIATAPRNPLEQA